MATYTDNYNLKKPAGSDTYNIADFNGNADIIDAQLKANADAITAVTNGTSAINGVKLAKSGNKYGYMDGNTFKSFRSPVGNAEPEHVLNGRTFSNTDGDALEGTMKGWGNQYPYLNAGESYTIPQGYHSGGGVVRANSLSSQTAGTATAANILKSKTAWVNGTKLTGTMENRGNPSASIEPGQTYLIQQGYYSGGGAILAKSIEDVYGFESPDVWVAPSGNITVIIPYDGVTPVYAVFLYKLANASSVPIINYTAGEIVSQVYAYSDSAWRGTAVVKTSSTGETRITFEVPSSAKSNANTVVMCSKMKKLTQST